MSLFDLHQVTFQYGSMTALRDVSCSVMPGERLALLGSNGSGKSTLLRLLNGLYMPTAGHIRFRGELLSHERLQDPSVNNAFRRSVVLLFQDPDVQLFNATVFDEVAFGPLQLGWPREQITEQVEAAMHLLEVDHLRTRAPYHLSGGEKKRVALASVLVLDPDVLLLDEPTAALDPRSQHRLLALLTDLSADKTVIVATHDLPSLEMLANNSLVLSQGQLIARGATPDILADLALLQRANLINPT